MEELLSRARQVAEEAEVFQFSMAETPVRFEANRIKHILARQDDMTALRLVKKGRIGYATARGVVDRETLLAKALETSQFGAFAEFDFPALSSGKGVRVFDGAVAKVTLEDMIGLGEVAILRIRDHTPEAVCDAWATKAIVSVRLINSRGGEVSYRKSVFGFGLEAVLVRGTDMLFVGDGESSCHPSKGVDKIVETVTWQLEHARRQASVPSRPLPVIFTPRGLAGVFLLPLTLAFNGRVVLQGASPLEKRVGELVFDERLSLYDDATIHYRPSSRPFDDEGVPSQSTPLIKSGVVCGFLHDLNTAARARSKSTGNGSRGEGGLPSPAASALLVKEGDTSFEDMVRDMKEGLLVEHLMGAGQGNLLSGDFSGNVLLGYKIENGEIVGRIKDTMLSGNVYEALKHLVAIGNKAEWVGGFVKAPYLCCGALSVSAKG